MPANAGIQELMRALFFAGVAALAAFEVASVYFIMPFPGSQGLASGLGIAYFLHQWRWGFRALCVAAMVIGARDSFRGRVKWLAAPALLAVAAIAGFFNYVASADAMFRQAQTLSYAGATQNTVPGDALVIAVERGGEARAWPIRYLVYHHQVRDTLAGKPIMVTYCSVCRSGRAYEPLVESQVADFRLVGMDHFNAMFEDAGTGSWWRQVSGRAVAGPLTGQQLPVVQVTQLSVQDFFARHPAGTVMQADPASLEDYDTDGHFERGESKGELTRTERAPWQDKSWVVGVEAGGASKAYDWNQLARDKVINDELGGTPIGIVLAADGKGFAAFERPGREPLASVADWESLKRVPAYQEFWHSWRTFHPDTLR
jgi:hypothetical protein